MTGEQQRSIAQAWRRGGLTAGELWSRYFELGGAAGPRALEDYLAARGSLPGAQADLLAQAVNERLDELVPAVRATYSRPFRDSRPRGRPLGALVRLLEGAVLSPPERLPALVTAAGGVLGVAPAVYLVDYDQRRLHPMGGGEALDIDNTLAGRAFREVRVLPAETPGRPRLWVPLLDGVERLGVLEVEVDDPAELYDPGLRTQCRWLASLLGHLVTAVDGYGDAFDRVRIRTSRTLGAELIWALLPPLTAGVDNLVVTGVVEPSERASGDAFDYALSETTADLIVLDAVGHDLGSGLITATALSAYRAARRDGMGLFEQARAIDEIIAGQFGRSLFATAVLAEIDLGTGRMRYLNAGHPPPLIMRGGKVVKPLTDGRRRPLGLGAEELTIGEETLEPDDWLVIHTDGITEARDADGTFFGEERLADFLQREAAAGHPPPETARRVVQAVLKHQHGALQDDATMVLARWTSARGP
ncbi:PP2C family protein-serine/threonine phosphatase [Amycolatopsis thermophila]|uniref:PPM-type phosphatase domain-containing protein n=1 Tax=Amycolatopsis thermophila TaxID=206084 RepID=A0ABU0EYE5_9PSEU|nr:SpoIIE family protein phosphatase [Amycolatopsis thermophila]MDQ0380345.1 hypothetical protein [Amycolatopsis thermophila]